MNEMPTLMNYTSTSNAFNFEDLQNRWGGKGAIIADPVDYQKEAQRKLRTFEALQRKQDFKPKQEKPMADTRRIVKVYVVDPDPNLPIEKALLYQTEEKFTELTDQELFFELNIQPLLEKHNELRKSTVNKKATAKADKEQMLEPIRIRDLKMVVVDVAAF